MILTPSELAAHRYDCPYCNAAGSVSDPPSPQPDSPPTPETTDGASPPPDEPVRAPKEQWKAEREAEAKARADKSAEEARKWEELQARFKATAELRKRLEARSPQPAAASEDETEQSAEPVEPEDEPIPKDADWDVSFDDLGSDYWEWFYDRRKSLSFGEPPEHYERDKDEE
jgi:hypothetical protein